MFEPDDDGKADPIIIGCVEAAYAHFGYDVKVYHERLVMDDRGSINGWKTALDAYPLAHRLYIALTGKTSPLFYTALNFGAKSRNLDDPELIRDMLDDTPHDDLDLLGYARIRAHKRAIRDRSPAPVFATGIEGKLIAHHEGRS